MKWKIITEIRLLSFSLSIQSQQDYKIRHVNKHLNIIYLYDISAFVVNGMF